MIRSRLLLFSLIVLVFSTCKDDRINLGARAPFSPAPSNLPWTSVTALSFTTTSTTGVILLHALPNITWRIASKPSWLTVTPDSGLSEAALTVNAITVNLSQGTRVDKIIIVTAVNTIEIAVTLSIIVPTEEVSSSSLLPGAVVDAEYDRIGDKLYVVTATNKLLQLSSEGQLLSTLSLPKLPTCISVGQNGQKAVVGYDGFISLIDLVSMTVSVTYPVSCAAGDVVLGPNSYAYVFPLTGQFTNIRCVNLQTGAELLNTGGSILSGTKARLHPSGDYIYGANNGVTPNDVEKYDIRGGQAIRMYDSPYHGEHSFGGELWLADDGAKMFTRARTIFNLTNTPGTDMLYVGIIPGISATPPTESIKTMDYVAFKNRIAAIFFDYSGGTPMNLVHFFTADFLNVLDTRTLPYFNVITGSTTQLVESEGFFGFYNSSGTKFIVVIKSKTISGVVDQWAVVNLAVN